ncbi:hypothetical protein ASC87_23565 [Rhizobacter sp. Root1221]|nr:hypothetical protein ASC87_23565 [Rhizobacter sp. Root1221]
MQASVRGALDRLVARHEVLHTRYKPLPGVRFPVQQVSAGLRAVWTEAGADTLGQAARSLLDPAGGAVVGVATAVSGDRFRWALAVPRGTLDAEGLQALVRECIGGGADTSDVLQYADYAAWQAELFESDVGQDGARFWAARLPEPGDRLRLPFEAVVAGPAARVTHGLDAAAVKALGDRTREAPETVLFALWAAFVARIAPADAVPIAWQAPWRAEELQGALGCFSTPLPLMLKPEPTHSVAEAVAAVAGELATASSWYECFDAADRADRLARRGAPEAGLGFAHVRVAALPAGWSCQGLDIDPLATRLHCEVVESPAGWQVTLQSGGACAEDVLAMWARQFAAMVVSAAGDTAAPWATLDLVGAAERDALWTAGRVGFEALPAGLLHEAFEAQARRTPSAPAVVCGGDRLTYAELDARADAWALCLQQRGATPDRVIGVHIGRSVHAVVAMLAVLKSGAAYVPIDPAYPADRIGHVLGDATISMVLALSSHRAQLAPWALDVLCVDEPVPAGHPARGLARPDHLAYAIYTSGSTGLPKGVMVAHRNAVVSTAARAAFYRAPVSGYLLLSSFSFDSSVAGIFWTLGQGGLLHVPTDEEHQDPVHLARLIAAGTVSHLLALPSFFKQILGSVEDAGALCCAIVAGEACHPDTVRAHRAHLPGAILVNEYGPTEATVWSHAHTVVDDGEPAVPIGRPVASVSGLVLDDRLALSPLGQPGELYLGGAGITRGYWCRPGLTAERFVADPFVPGGRLYRTGDLVRCRPDGALEYLGRTDHQVKVRGFRIELGEVESALLAQPGVGEAVAAARDGQGGLRLVAYVTPRAGARVDTAVLRDALARSLPAHMVPAVVAVLADLPRMPNGKVDRRALPDPDLGGQRPFDPPRDATEQAFCDVWRDVLGLERVGRSDNFFELGGDSIIGLQIVARLRKAGWKVAPKQLFDRQTVAELAAVAERQDDTGVRSLVSGEAPLLPIQAARREGTRPCAGRGGGAPRRAAAALPARCGRCLAPVVRGPGPAGTAVGAPRTRRGARGSVVRGSAVQPGPGARPVAAGAGDRWPRWRVAPAAGGAPPGGGRGVVAGAAGRPAHGLRAGAGPT